MEYIGVALYGVMALAIIIVCVFVIIKVLAKLLYIESFEAYIDEDTEGYINGPHGRHR